MREEHESDVDRDRERQLSEFRRKLTDKYDAVFDEPMPERLVDLIHRLREIKPS